LRSLAEFDSQIALVYHNKLVLCPKTHRRPKIIIALKKNVSFGKSMLPG